LCGRYEPSFEHAKNNNDEDVDDEDIQGFNDFSIDEDLTKILGVRMMDDNNGDPLLLGVVYLNCVELFGDDRKSVLIPVTKTQRAQVIDWAHKLLGYCEACARIGGYCGLCSGAHWHAKQPWSRG
jgi:hypothetical protein